MLKRLLFVRRLFFIVFLFFFVIDVRAMDDATTKQKQNFLRENILEKGYDADEFMEFLESKKGEKGLKIENWTMGELEPVVKEFTQQNQKENALENLVEKDQIPAANEEINENNSNLEVVNNNIILQTKNEGQAGDNNVDKKINGQNMVEKLSVENPNQSMQNNQFVQGSNDSINITHDQSSLKSPFYDLSHNNIVSSFFCFYRYGGKFLASLVWSVVNSYCGFEQLVMNDWYCYAMCSGYRLQPRFMHSRVWIDMNFNFLEGIAGFLIRFFLFYPSYDMYENIFDFFNVCIDIKVYNNLYFAVNIVGIVQGVYCLLIRRAREKRFAEQKKNISQNKKKTKYVINFFV